MNQRFYKERPIRVALMVATQPFVIAGLALHNPYVMALAFVPLAIAGYMLYSVRPR